MTADVQAAVERAAAILRDQHGEPWVVTWRYVSGGRALHAFFPGETVPCCGERAERGPDGRRRTAMWRERGSSPTAVRRRKAHGVCLRASRVRVAQIRETWRQWQATVVAKIMAGEL